MAIDDYISPEDFEAELKAGFEIPSVSTDFSLDTVGTPDDIFKEGERAAWHKNTSPLARCDMKKRIRLVPRAGVFFFALWQKSVTGRLLTEIKQDSGMIDHFASNVAVLINRVLGKAMRPDQFCIITAPKRRHLHNNFASAVSQKLSDLIGIPFIDDVCSCKSKQRIGAVFKLEKMPEQNNLIVFDDIVTTGSTLKAIYNLFDGKKNMLFFTGINNAL